MFGGARGRKRWVKRDNLQVQSSKLDVRVSRSFAEPFIGAFVAQATSKAPVLLPIWRRT